MKIFCIGVFRCGTTSFREYMRSIGINTVGWKETACNYNHYPHNMTPIMKTLDDFDAFTDIPYNYESFISKMIEMYPDALFFLPMRDADEWIGSINRHASQRVLGVSNLITPKTLSCVGITGKTDNERKESFKQRNTRVIETFRSKNISDRLLVYNLGEKNMKEKIDAFLVNKKVIQSASKSTFPHTESTK